MNNITKRIIAYILTTAIAVAPVAAQAKDAVIYSDDFEAYTVGVGGNGQAGLDVFSGEVRYSENNKFIALTEANAMATHNFDSNVSSDIVLLSTDIYVEDSNEVRIQLLNSDSKHAMRLRIGGGTIKFTYHNGAQQTEMSAGPMPTGQWVTISAEFDFDNKRITQFYVDGVPKLSADANYYFYDLAADAAHNITFWNHSGNSGFYIDNV